MDLIPFAFLQSHNFLEANDEGDDKVDLDQDEQRCKRYQPEHVDCFSESLVSPKASDDRMPENEQDNEDNVNDRVPVEARRVVHRRQRTFQNK